ncbi:ABC transporter substrate-binding protein [Prosthecomicrobium sp. N25]|uniref:ABC transporter substrate-binding protein n=1 Tax=Prosthecomicrobium sp. N25 TaxID=3129254 RepID=UPI003078157D
MQGAGKLAFTAAFLLSISRVPAADGLKIEVIHNMSAQSQQPAVQVLVDALKERGVRWVDNAFATGPAARAAMVHRAATGEPAAVMFVHSKLLFRELTERGLTASVGPPGWRDWKDKVAPEIWEEMTGADGRVIFTPIILGIHNVAFLNKAILKRAGAETPQTWDEFFVVLQRIRGLGGVVPLAFTDAPVQLFQTFHNLVAGLGGRPLYQSIFVEHDPRAFDRPEFRRVAEALRRLKPFTDPGRTSRVWQDAAMMVASGRAGALVYGTFALQPFITAGKLPGEDVECANLGGVAILGPNGFMYGRPESEAQREAQNRFAATVMDPEVQALFVEAYGGFPTRRDADRSTLNGCMESAGEGLADPARTVKDPSLTMDPRRIGAVQDAVVEFWANEDESIEAFAGKLKAAVAARDGR